MKKILYPSAALLTAFLLYYPFQTAKADTAQVSDQ